MWYTSFSMKTHHLCLFSLFVLSVFGRGNAFADTKWDIGAGVTGSYDDNITSVHDDRVSDFITRTTVGGGFVAQGKTGQVALKGALTENFYASNASFNNFSQALSGNAFQELSPYYTVTVGDVFSHTEEPRNFEDEFGRNTGRYSSYKNSFNLGYTRILSEQLKLNLRYRQADDIYASSSQLDAHEYAPGISGEYAFDSANQAMLDYDHSNRHFEGGQEATIQTLSAGFRHYLTPQWYAEVKPGVTFIESFNNTSSTKPRYELSLTDDVDENTRANIKYVKEFGANAFSQEIFDNWRTVLTLFRQLTAKLGWNVSAFYGEGTYTVSKIKDKTSGINTGVEYSLNKKASLFLSYLHSNTDSNIDTRSYSRNMAQLGVKFAF